ncbi:hypothetical protein L3X38_025904 [Prunus dulcis]|uniref:Uncharacterized protein n=1 Tax=Prunus dulcis TaxID=3755 RepID=A0AAD4Z7H6_PRUDU|nr:hypothetical protein L3X38_025904 [Prunus dulcis]
MPQAQPPLPALASVPFASYDSRPSNPTPTLAMFTPPPSSPAVSSSVPPGLPSPPPSDIPSINLLTSSPSRSKDPHRKIVFLYVVPISSGTSFPSSSC